MWNYFAFHCNPLINEWLIAPRSSSSCDSIVIHCNAEPLRCVISLKSQVLSNMTISVYYISNVGIKRSRKAWMEWVNEWMNKSDERLRAREWRVLHNRISRSEVSHDHCDETHWMAEWSHLYFKDYFTISLFDGLISIWRTAFPDNETAVNYGSALLALFASTCQIQCEI